MQTENYCIHYVCFETVQGMAFTMRLDPEGRLIGSHCSIASPLAPVSMVVLAGPQWIITVCTSEGRTPARVAAINASRKQKQSSNKIP